jgi:nucleoside-diphosphate-sugar epimerase
LNAKGLEVDIYQDIKIQKNFLSNYKTKAGLTYVMAAIAAKDKNLDEYTFLDLNKPVKKDLVEKIIRGQNPLHILGSGDELRCYTYGGDLAKGIVMSLDHPGARNEDFNLSTPIATSVLDLAKTIWSKIHGEHLPFEFIQDPGFEFDVAKRVPSVEKAKNVLGFTADTSLDEMLDEVIPWIADAINQGTI